MKEKVFKKEKKRQRRAQGIWWTMRDGLTR